MLWSSVYNNNKCINLFFLFQQKCQNNYFFQLTHYAILLTGLLSTLLSRPLQSVCSCSRDERYSHTCNLLASHSYQVYFQTVPKAKGIPPRSSYHSNCWVSSIPEGYRGREMGQSWCCILWPGDRTLFWVLPLYNDKWLEASQKSLSQGGICWSLEVNFIIVLNVTSCSLCVCFPSASPLLPLCFHLNSV